MVFDSLGNSNLWVRPMGGLDGRELPGTRLPELPFWSADSRMIGFFADGKLKKIPASGGTAEIVADAPSGRGGTWNHKGDIVYAPTSSGPLFRVRAAGGEPVAVTTVDTTLGETSHRFPAFLPDGKHFTYIALPGRKPELTCYVGSMNSTSAVPLLSASAAPIYAEPGYLIVARKDVLQIQGFDGRKLRLLGDPSTLVEAPLSGAYAGYLGASVSDNDILVLVSPGNRSTELVWLDAAGRLIGKPAVPVGLWTFPVISPDGRRALVSQDRQGGGADLWILDLDRGLANRITDGTGSKQVGVFSPDGRRLVYSSSRGGPHDLYVRSVEGPAEVVDDSDVGSDLRFEDEAAVSVLKEIAAVGFERHLVVVEKDEWTDGREVRVLSKYNGARTEHADQYPGSAFGCRPHGQASTISFASAVLWVPFILSGELRDRSENV